MKRIALLGATGSIGRQAIEVIDAHPELELVAATSGSQPIEGLAPLTQTGGDPTELLERAEPDVVLNAVVGFAGLIPTMWALENGVTLALANKESLVAAGELALAAKATGRGRADPGRQRALGALPVRAPRRAGEPRPHRQRRALPRPDSGRARRRHARGSARPPDLDDGPEDHDRLGHARQQGPRGDRGALPLRGPLRPDRGRDPSAVDRPRPRALPRRRRDRAPRESRHARPDLLRPDLPGAGRDAGPAARAPHTRVPRARHRYLPHALRSPARPESAAAPILAPTTPRTRSPSRPSSSAGSASSSIAAAVEDVLGAVDGSPARDLEELVEADARARNLVLVG